VTTITGGAAVAGIVGSPVSHSLSPLIHNAWIAAAGLDAAYVPFVPPAEGFFAFIEGLRGGAIRGLNVTVPFKEEALALATAATARARRAGAANVLVFGKDGSLLADNTDGAGMLAALAEQAPYLRATDGPALILGAGGAARGAAVALVAAKAPEIRIANRTATRADELAVDLGSPCRAVAMGAEAFDDVALVINATTLGLGGGRGPETWLERARPGAVVLDMIYKPLRSELLHRAAAVGCLPVDGLAMLIGQAAPSFEAFFGARPPAVDVRALCLAALGEAWT
jgi:shikimate dehydrogenase